ncbi:MAG: methionine--tRNA ligase [Candidatus Micrarchaeales archaeon]
MKHQKSDQVPKFYLTTPIYYVNDKPHVGHAYTTIVGDVIARWHRLKGEDVFYLTGTDEHGEKVEQAASKAGKSPKEFVDGIVDKYKQMWKALDVSYDCFIRTSDPKHEAIVSEMIEKIAKNGDIYKGFYEGWYCVPDETFWTALQLKDGKCPECGRDVKLVKEETYFFKLSKYQNKLLKFYKENPSFLSPKFRSKEILNRVNEGLNDVSITRTTIKWGVPFPLDKKHTVYVWVDALFNYISALGGTGSKDFKKYWPADVHLIAKEINWFHSVIWPALLFSAGIEPPKMIFAHGWLTVNGQKIGKSLGNAIDPVAIAKKYSLDALRYALIRELPFGADGDFSEAMVVTRLNNELVAELGNLLNRTVTIAEKYKGRIEGTPALDAGLSIKIKNIDKFMEELDTLNAITEIFSYIRMANKYINDNEPWKLKGDELGNVLYNLLESLRIISILISPFLPNASERMNAQLGLKAGKLDDCKFGKFEGKVKKAEHLFKKIEV